MFPRFAQASLGSIQAVDTREWLADLDRSGLSASRIRQAYFLLAQILRSAVESGYLAKNPCVGVKRPRMQVPEMRFVAADQVEVLASAIREPCGVLVNTLAYAGLRWGEAAALRRGRCELLRSRLHVVESLSETSEGLQFGATKTYQRRTVVIPGFLRDHLPEHLATYVRAADDALVFPFPERRTAASRQLQPAGVEGRDSEPRPSTALPPPHLCRAPNRRGGHPKAVQAQLGHSSIQVTMDRYGHLFPSAAEELAGRLDAVHRRTQTPEAPGIRVA